MSKLFISPSTADDAYIRDLPATPQPPAEPLEELVLELTDLQINEQDGKRRASAHARLVYQTATLGQSEVVSAKSWRLAAPLGPIEAAELKWYLEKYAVWPSHYYKDRARKLEENLVTWGRLLHEAALPVAHTANVMQAWASIGSNAGRRFSVKVDAVPEAGAVDADAKIAQEAAILLLGLPWELLHDGGAYLFQGAKPTRVRRRLPRTQGFDVPVVALPIRILLITARPEDDACGYIDHRVSALPLVNAMEALPGLVKMNVLSPPTLPALRQELERAREAKEPYHVLHFDGHGGYDKQAGAGGLCFESPEDIAKLENRRHVTVFTGELGPLLRDHRIPLVFLEACQTAQAEGTSESVASELLKVGVASVVAMSHSVLVETARRFVEAFYQALANGKRVGDAMLAGQRQLKDDPVRGHVFGEGELRLEDWFVPVLFQEKDDPQLFKFTPGKQTVNEFRTDLMARLGKLPPESETGFVGRSRELLALQRLLQRERYAVIRGQGGEGKTALAAEFARWLVRSHQIERAAFVSVETHSHVAAVLDALGRQLVGNGYSVATFENVEKAILPIERALREQPTLLVVDNMESILLPQFVAAETPEALSQDARHELDTILGLCARLKWKGNTRLLFTSREVLPAPFDLPQRQCELYQLDHEDAVKLVERVLNEAGGNVGTSTDVALEEIEQLVKAVHGHARTLALLAPALQRDGVEKTRASLTELMAEMENAFPGNREKSVFASVELSLRRLSKANRGRLSKANRGRARVLGVFHGGFYLGVLSETMQWDLAEAGSLAVELVETGLATPNRFNHLTLNPALCPYLRGRLGVEEREVLMTRWVEAMRAYVGFLLQQKSHNIEVATSLTVLDLQNLFALLDLVPARSGAEGTISLATALYSLLEFLGKPRLLEHIGKVRDAAVVKMGAAWNRAQFQAAGIRINQLLAGGQFPEALAGAQQLLGRVRAEGELAYKGADYDLALACEICASVLRTAGRAEQALPLFQEARVRFESFEKREPGGGGAQMVSVSIAQHGDCFFELGRLEEAALAYTDSIGRSEQLNDTRHVAATKGQLGRVLLEQHRYSEALEIFAEARQRFIQLGEPRSVATSWHQTGIVQARAGQPEAAEDAYQESLAINVRLGNSAGIAETLGQLGNLYDDTLHRPEDAAKFYLQAADKYIEIADAANEGSARSSLAETLRRLRRLDEARQEILQAIKCKERFGHTAETWKSWAILADIERDAGNLASASEAKGKAISSYLDYRRAGGENHYPSGRLAFKVTKFLQAGEPARAMSFLKEVAMDPQAAWLIPILPTFQAIIAGSRDRALTDTPDLPFKMAAEIIILIETLSKPK